MSRLLLLTAWFRSKFYDQSIVPLVLALHEFHYHLCQFPLSTSINDSAQSHVLVAVHLERDSRMVPDVLYPVSLVTILRDEIESPLVTDVPDFYSVRCLGLPPFGSEIEELVFAVLQERPSPRRIADAISSVCQGHKQCPESPPSSQRAGRLPG